MNSEAAATKICPNCSAELRGQYCFACGQNQKPVKQHFGVLLSEALEDVLTPDSRTARTLGAICFRPGHLTRQYFRGRRARYIQPVRLYFITSITFFFLASLASSVQPMPEVEAGQTVAPESQQERRVTGLDVEFLDPEETKLVEEKLNAQIDKAVQLVTNDPERVREMIFDTAPPVIFCLLPLFAALLKLFYLNSGRYYTEHLVLALHNHSFIFIALLIGTLIDLIPAASWRGWLQTPVDIWVPIYLLLSLKTTFRQGWGITLLKFSLLASSYLFLFVLAAVITLIVRVLAL